MLRTSYSVLAGIAALFAALALGCGLAAQPPKTIIHGGPAMPDSAVAATQSAEAWLTNNSSLLVTEVAKELERGATEGYQPRYLDPFLELVKSADAEKQLGKAIEWEVGIARADQGHYEVMIVGNGEIAFDGPHHWKTVYQVESTALLVINGVTQVVDEYQMGDLSFSSRLNTQ